MAGLPGHTFYSLLFKIMELLNLLLFLLRDPDTFSAKYDFIHLPVSLDTISLVALLTASALGIFGWKYLLCNLITAGAFLFLAFHVALSPVSLATDYTYTQLLSLIPAVVYMLHAGWLKLKKMKNKSLFKPDFRIRRRYTGYSCLKKCHYIFLLPDHSSGDHRYRKIFTDISDHLRHHSRKNLYHIRLCCRYLCSHIFISHRINQNTRNTVSIPSSFAR